MRSPFRFLTALTVASYMAFPAPVSAAGSTSIVINELLTGTSTGAGQEFVELYNNSKQPIELDGWRLEYKSATSANLASSWSKKAELSGVIKESGYYLAAPLEYYPDADANWSSTLAAGGGHVRLVDPDGNTIDLVGYGNANSPENRAAPAPSAGSSLGRQPIGADSDNNSTDFTVAEAPSPVSSWEPVDESTDESANDQDEPANQPNDQLPELEPSSEISTAEPMAETTVYPKLHITELLIDPESPLTDAEDEYIELFNPGSSEVQLEGYILKTGTDLKNSYTFQSGVVPAMGYLAVFSKQSGIPLTNSGGGAQLLSPIGEVIDQTATYAKAKPGDAWVRDGENWIWTSTPTPGQQNLLTGTQSVLAAAVKTVKPAAIKKPKAATSKSSKPKAAKSSAKKKSAKSGASEPVKVAAAKIKPATWLIILLAVITIGYAIYEFRHDIKNHFQRFRAYFSARWANRRKAKGR